MYNYIIYNEYFFPKQSLTYLADYTTYDTRGNTPLLGYPTFSSKSLTLPGRFIDGIEGNTRKVLISYNDTPGFESKFLVVGTLFNGSVVTEEVTIAAIDTQVKTTNYFYQVDAVYPSIGIETGNILKVCIGYSDEGFTAITLSNGAKSDHFITWNTGTANVTVYGSMNTFLNIKTTLEDLKFYPLSTTLTGITATMTAPEYYLQPAGFFRAYIAPGSTDMIKYRVSLQSLFN